VFKCLHVFIQDTNELRLELVRKEELIKRHYEKIAVWQNLLADLQGWAKSPAQGPTPSGLPNGNAGPQPPAPPTGAPPQPNMPNSIQQQLQQQQLQQQQMQQMQQQQMQQQIQQQQMQQQVAFWGENTGQYDTVPFLSLSYIRSNFSLYFAFFLLNILRVMKETAFQKVITL
jgi:hypothetical protein